MSSSSVSRGWALPALCAATEATWATVALGALVNGSNLAHHVALPYGALAVPLVVAAVVAKTLRRRPGSAAGRLGLIVVVAFVGAVLTAGLVAALSSPSLTLDAALHPWSLNGRAGGTVAGTAWVVAFLTWGRGTWLGAARIALSDTVVSLTIGSAVFVVVILVGRHTHHELLRACAGPSASRPPCSWRSWCSER